MFRVTGFELRYKPSPETRNAKPETTFKLI